MPLGGLLLSRWSRYVGITLKPTLNFALSRLSFLNILEKFDAALALPILTNLSA